MYNKLFNLGWAMMGLPVGYREVSPFLMKYGPYRWGAALCDWSYEQQRKRRGKKHNPQR